MQNWLRQLLRHWQSNQSFNYTHGLSDWRSNHHQAFNGADGLSFNHPDDPDGATQHCNGANDPGGATQHCGNT